ncbi:hypothetical protein NQZ68_000243 [Dissostichus eleginoides]|nr:hypothetical protein NQZ68_000243 [Dissostichus eleginoides]
MEKIESTDATEGTGEEFPVNGTPVAETPSVVTGTPFDFAPLSSLALTDSGEVFVSPQLWR